MIFFEFQILRLEVFCSIFVLVLLAVSRFINDNESPVQWWSHIGIIYFN